MRCELGDIGQADPAFRPDDGNLRVGHGKLLDRLDRLPQDQRQKLNLPIALAAQQVGTLVATLVSARTYRTAPKP